VSEFEQGDRVQDCIWDGSRIGRVARVLPNGNPSVRWRDRGGEEEMAPHQIQKIGDAW
jgi:hypothetical protein